MSRMLLLLSLVALSGCATTYSRGRKIAEQGQFEQASRYWMAALDEDMEAKGPRKGLEQYAPSAVWVYMETAQEHEAERRYDDALAAFGSALSLAEEFVVYGVEPGLDREELAAQIVDLEDDYAEYRYNQGIDAVQHAEFTAAIDWFEAARELRPDYEDTTQQIGDAYREAAHLAVRDHNYTESLALFASAWTWTRDAEARAWHDVVAVALGRYYLGQGACRGAFELFDAVRDTANDATLQEDLARSEDCSLVEVVVYPFEWNTMDESHDTDVAGIVTDAVTERIREGATPYLRLVDPALAEGVPNTFGKRYGVRGRLSQVRLERPEPSSEALTVLGTHKVTCPLVDGYAEYSAELCDEVVELSYEVHSQGVTLGLTGSVRVSDPRTGELMVTRGLDTRVVQESVHRSALRTETEHIRIAQGATEDIYAVPQAILDMPIEATELPRDSQLLSRASTELADAAAAAVLEAVDVEETPRPPRSLDIRTPMTDPSQIEFGAGESQTEDNPTRAVIRNTP